MNVFGIEGDILVAGYDADGWDHFRTLRQVVKICQHDILNLIKINAILGALRYHFQEVVARDVAQ